MANTAFVIKPAVNMAANVIIVDFLGSAIVHPLYALYGDDAPLAGNNIEGQTAKAIGWL